MCTFELLWILNAFLVGFLQSNSQIECDLNKQGRRQHIRSGGGGGGGPDLKEIIHTKNAILNILQTFSEHNQQK